ncbi:MAG: ABC transporter permease [Deltaproteobacteria bacterium]|nr:MAG: ABC transporter permease [Deltaproteobacteria bacterium]
MIGQGIYFLLRALRNMRHSPVLSAASIFTVGVALALLAFFAIAVLNVQRLTASWAAELAVVAYLEQPPEGPVLNRWLGEIRGYPEVASVTYVSRQEAYQRFRQRLGSDADLLDGLGADVLPASLEIRLKPEARQQTAAVVERLGRNKALGELHYGREWLDRFEAFLLLLRTVGIALGGFLVLAALVIVTNTIKLTLYARQDELEAMTMVGATALFIKLPYLIEGALQGVVGGLVALLTSFVAFRMILRESLGNILLLTGIDTIHFLPFTWQILLVAAGGLVGLLGSLLALRKFVRFCQD